MRPGRRAANAGARALLWLCGGLTAALLAAVVGYVCVRGVPGLSWELLTGAESVLEGTPGLLPAIINTVVVVVIALAAVLPVGVGAAVYLTEYARAPRLVRAIEFAADTLAGIPSLLYALVGTILFCNVLGLQKTLLAGALTLAIMTVPTVLRSTQESLKAVPRSYREGALGLGAGQWRTIRTLVLPASVDGVVTGCILAAGRIVGETAVLMYTAGLSTAMQDFSSIEGFMKASGATLTVALYVYAKERADFAAAFTTGTILLGITAVINFAAAVVGRKMRRR